MPSPAWCWPCIGLPSTSTVLAAARAVGADRLGAGQIELIAQDFEQRGPRLDFHLDDLSIHVSVIVCGPLATTLVAGGFLSAASASRRGERRCGRRDAGSSQERPPTEAAAGSRLFCRMTHRFTPCCSGDQRRRETHVAEPRRRRRAELRRPKLDRDYTDRPSSSNQIAGENSPNGKDETMSRSAPSERRGRQSHGLTWIALAARSGLDDRRRANPQRAAAHFPCGLPFGRGEGVLLRLFAPGAESPPGSSRTP